ncbi:MAG: PadR family transcriptional regulator [Microbacteriaceae bacterium]
MESLSRITAATIDVLTVLEHEGASCWGLLIIKSSGRPAGTVYPILERLEQAGWVTSRWEEDDSRPGPRRRYYELTEGGAAAARTAIGQFATRRRTTAPALTPVVELATRGAYGLTRKANPCVARPVNV